MQKWLLLSPQTLKILVPGRIITLYVCKYKYLSAAVLAVVKRVEEIYLTVLLLCDVNDVEEEITDLINVTENYLCNVHVFEPFKNFYYPELTSKHAVVDISGRLIANVTEEIIKIDPEKIIKDYKQRQIPRFQ